jgi:hypothetical protein
MIFHAMANLYFCQPHPQNQGMLRAVIPLKDCRRLVAPGKITYIGEQFPAVWQGQGPAKAADFAVLGVKADEADGDWRPGYYRFDADLTELNAQLLTLVP